MRYRELTGIPVSNLGSGSSAYSAMSGSGGSGTGGAGSGRSGGGTGGEGGRDPREGRKGVRINMLWFYAALALGILAVQFFFSEPKRQETSWQEVRQKMLDKGYVRELVGIRNKGVVEVYLTQEGLEAFKDRLGGSTSGYTAKRPAFYFTIGSIETFEKQLAQAQEEMGVPESERLYAKYEERVDYVGGLLTWVIPFALLILLWMFMFRRMSNRNGGIFNVGKSKAELFNQERHVKVNFSDVAGMEEAKVEVLEIVDFLRNPQKYTELGGKIPKGALLVGPPGTGKTLLAKAVAGEADVPFFSLSGSDFVEMFVGVGASRVRDLFKQAKEKAPCIIFIDEIDAIGRARSKNVNFSSGEERENTLNQLLTEMDGFSTNQGVIVLAATNRADILDRALLRAGRFDRQIHVELPDYQERYAIFQVHLRPLKLEAEFDPTFLAKQTPGFSGADIANVCNEAALIAARGGHKEVRKQDFLDAIDRIVGGLERKSKILTDEEKVRVAYHEAGHATVSWKLEEASPLLKVSIIPRGRSLGAAWYVPEERQLTTRDQLFQEMAAILGGRASEEVVFGEISTGALNDLERVNRMAYSMVAYYGMMDDEMRNMCYYDSTGQSEYTFTKPFSERTAEKIDRAVKQVIDEAYALALRILRENREGLERLAKKLLEEEVIFSDDVEAIYGPRSRPVFPEIEMKGGPSGASGSKGEGMGAAKAVAEAESAAATVSASVVSSVPSGELRIVHEEGGREGQEAGSSAKHLSSVGHEGGEGDLRSGGHVRGLTGEAQAAAAAESAPVVVPEAAAGARSSGGAVGSDGEPVGGVSVGGDEPGRAPSAKHLDRVGREGGPGDLRMRGLADLDDSGEEGKDADRGERG